jgi:signal transduction histidine kinase
MRPSTLSSRVALVQTATTLVALAVVVLGAWGALRALLTWKTDQVLQSTLEQAAGYLRVAEPNSPKWAWVLEEIQEHRPLDARVEIRDATGALRAGFGPGAELSGVVDTACAYRAQHRVCGKRVGSFVILAGRDDSDTLVARGQWMLALVVATVVAALLVALTSRFVAARALGPLSELTARVAAVLPGEGTRVGLQTRLQEIDRLAEKFDELVARFEEALAREKRFSAEASHELRTPLTIARGEIEELRRRGGTEGTDRAIAALDRLGALVEALLWFARAQGRLDDARMDVVNVADLVRTLLDELRRTYPDREFSCAFPDEALVRGDEHLISRAAANLLDNAIKHGDATAVGVRLTRNANQAVLTITNGGAVLESVRDQIFIPFFRATTGGNGFGLGLPFARAVARAHGGDVELGAARSACTELILRLPLIAWHERAEVPQ